MADLIVNVERREARLKQGTYRGTYARECLPSPEQQRQRLEVLRYKWTRETVYPHLMQRLGDTGRQYLPSFLIGLYGLGVYAVLGMVYLMESFRNRSSKGA